MFVSKAMLGHTHCANFFRIIQNTHTWSHRCTLELTVLQIYLSTNTYPQLNWFCYTVYGSYREIDNIQRYALNSAESKTCRAVDEIPNNRKEYIPDRGRGPFFLITAMLFFDD